VAERAIALTQAGPPLEAGHWTGTAMAKAAGISVSPVQCIWRAHGLRPHLVRQFKLSTDPQFAAKLKEIVTHDYKRHGVTTLFAALNVLEGNASANA
jgi:hypothetical protein